MGRQEIGVVGMGVMGTNLALNIESKGYPVAVYSWKSEETERFMAAKGAGRNIAAAYTVEEFAAALRPPRRILIMVTAGAPVDNTIEQLKPHLSPGDILIDGGNSFFMDTIRRSKALEKEGLRYIGAGISGGEEGALKGPSIMPGGQPDAYAQVEEILTAIAAKVDGEPCCTYIGADGAGHYVKMVHNGIEYGDMQLICEAYHLMKNLLGMGAGELRDTFAEWNRGELDSYLIEITRDIFGNIDAETGKPLVEMILDTAGQKGTGKWTSQSALDLGVPAPTIAEAVFARCLSALKSERAAASKLLPGPAARFSGDRKAFIENIRKALYASKICSYAQGFALLRAAAAEYGWQLDYGRIAMIWRGGCIIRARFLHKIKEAFDRDPALANLLLDPYFKNIIQGYQGAWRAVAAAAIEAGLPAPAFTSALAYYDAYRSESLPANLLQAQRDYFGAHTFQRLDKPGVFHHEWERSS